MSNGILFFNFSSRRLDIFPDLFGRPIRTNIHTYVNVIGPNYELAQSHFFLIRRRNKDVKAKGDRKREWAEDAGRRPSVLPERGSDTREMGL